MIIRLRHPTTALVETLELDPPALTISLGHVRVSIVTVHSAREVSRILLFGDAGKASVGSAARWALVGP